MSAVNLGRGTSSAPRSVPRSAPRSAGATGAGCSAGATGAGLSGAGRGAAGSLHIDWTLCDGRGLCTELLPELLERDDWGYPVAVGPPSVRRSDVPVPPELVDAARDAVALCPRAALRLRPLPPP